VKISNSEWGGLAFASESFSGCDARRREDRAELIRFFEEFVDDFARCEIAFSDQFEPEPGFVGLLEIFNLKSAIFNLTERNL